MIIFHGTFQDLSMKSNIVNRYLQHMILWRIDCNSQNINCLVFCKSEEGVRIIDTSRHSSLVWRRSHQFASSQKFRPCQFLIYCNTTSNSHLELVTFCSQSECRRSFRRVPPPVQSWQFHDLDAWYPYDPCVPRTTFRIHGNNRWRYP